MNSGHIQGRFLAMISAMIRPARILELGTYAGYSALCLAEGLQHGGEVITLEVNDELESFISESLASSPFGSRVRPLYGDALTLMAGMKESAFDLIFIDADKRRYPEYFAEALRLVRDDGFILADNTLWDGHIADPAYDRDRQTLGLRRFNEAAAASPDVETLMLPLRDGLTLMRRKPRNPSAR